LGDHAGAVRDAEDALRLKPADARGLYSVARIYALAAQPAGKAGRPDRQGRAIELVRQAVRLVPPAARAGFWRDHVAADPAMKPLRLDRRFAAVEDEALRNR
jgi:hypothetical protein